MQHKFHSKAKHMLWNLDEEVIVNVLGRECDKPTSSSSLKPSGGSLYKAFHVMITMFLEGPFS